MKPHNRLMQLLRENVQQHAEGDPVIRVDASGSGAAEVYVYDVIDPWWGASAEGLSAALSGLAGRDVNLHINSPGGDVFEGRAMAAALVAYPGKVVSCIDGLCASAATYLANAANEVQMTQGSMLMVHNSWTIAYGNKAELAATVGLLEKIDSQIAADYARRTGAALAQVVAWMDAETWFTEEEALAAKFIDRITPNSKREAGAQASAKRWNLSAYANAPQREEPLQPSRQEIDALVSQQLQRNRNRLRVLTPI
jgi:ATP-dependent Clp protease, protease subunit